MIFAGSDEIMLMKLMIVREESHSIHVSVWGLATVQTIWFLEKGNWWWYSFALFTSGTEVRNQAAHSNGGNHKTTDFFFVGGEISL